MQLTHIRAEIEHMRRQIGQRKEIQAPQRAGISTKSADEFLVRMQTKVDELCAERDRQVRGATRQISGHRQNYQRSDRAPVPVRLSRCSGIGLVLLCKSIR